MIGYSFSDIRSGRLPRRTLRIDDDGMDLKPSLSVLIAIPTLLARLAACEDATSSASLDGGAATGPGVETAPTDPCGGRLTLRCVVIYPPATTRILRGLARGRAPP